MGRHQSNPLRLEPLKNGSWLLHGFLKGERIRLRSKNHSKLAAQLRAMQNQLAGIPPENTVVTWLSAAQLKDAEAAILRAKGRGLVECVEASDRVMVIGDPVKLQVALDEWKLDLGKRGRSIRTVEKNILRAGAFLRFVPVATVGAVESKHFEDFVFRGDRADYTRTSDAAVLRAWVNFWIKRRWIKESPMTIDFKDLSSRARNVELPRILTPGQALALLNAANAAGGERMAAYVALATWCFLRHAEVLRVTPSDLKLDGGNSLVEIRPKKRGTVSYRTVSIPTFILPTLIAAKRKAIKAKQEAINTMEEATLALEKAVKAKVKKIKVKAKEEAELVIAKAEAVMKKTKAAAAKSEAVAVWGRVKWGRIRKNANLASLGVSKNKKRPVTSEIWQENILRHTGISYFYQKTGDVKETCRQAGNSSDTAFRHYLQLPACGAAAEFYSV